MSRFRSNFENSFCLSLSKIRIVFWRNEENFAELRRTTEHEHTSIFIYHDSDLAIVMCYRPLGSTLQHLLMVLSDPLVRLTEHGLLQLFNSYEYYFWYKRMFNQLVS